MNLKEAFLNRKSAEPAPEPPVTDERLLGRIYYLNKKGYGFIESDALPRQRIYFHWKFLTSDTKPFDELKKGDEVEFSPKQEDKGWKGIKVRLV